MDYGTYLQSHGGWVILALCILYGLSTLLHWWHQKTVRLGQENESDNGLTTYERRVLTGSVIVLFADLEVFATFSGMVPESVGQSLIVCALGTTVLLLKDAERQRQRAEAEKISVDEIVESWKTNS